MRPAVRVPLTVTVVLPVPLPVPNWAMSLATSDQAEWAPALKKLAVVSSQAPLAFDELSPAAPSPSQILVSAVLGAASELRLKLSTPKESRLPPPRLAERATTRKVTRSPWSLRLVNELRSMLLGVVPKAAGSPYVSSVVNEPLVPTR